MNYKLVEPIKPRKPSEPYCPVEPQKPSNVKECFIAKTYSSFDGNLQTLLNDFIVYCKMSNKNVSEDSITVADIKVKLYYECYYENSEFEFTLTYNKPILEEKTHQEKLLDERIYNDSVKQYKSRLNYYKKAKAKYDNQMVLYLEKLKEYNEKMIEFKKLKKEQERQQKLKLFNDLKKELKL